VGLCALPLTGAKFFRGADWKSQPMRRYSFDTVHLTGCW
jgi:hypothetical protein